MKTVTAQYDPWLMCQYGESNDIVIAKRLLKTVETCEISYTPNKFGGKTININCT
jgi:hypothetical protein